ncbi:MAG: V-type ATPase subunit [Candidatus Nealsonbacteria bacterium]
MSYLFAAGKIRSLEKRLLSRNDLELMLNSKNAEESFKIFNDTDLADNLLRVDAKNFAKAIADDLTQNRKFIEKIADGKILRLVFLKQDFHNVKIFLKGKANEGIVLENSVSPLGTVKSEDLKKRIMANDKKVRFDEDFEVSLENIKKRIKNPVSSREIDSACDQEYFKLLLKIAGKIKNEFILNFCKLQADLANFKILLRGRLMKCELNKISTIFIEGGGMEKNKFLSLYKKTDSEIFKFLKAHFKPSEEIFLEDYFKEGRLWQLERAFDDLLINYLEKAKLIASGPELIFAYAFSKYNSANNIRLVMVGKLNEIENEAIRKKLRKII